MCRINGKKLNEIRISRGLSQRDLAEKLNMSQNMISQYENGKVNPPDDVVERMAVVLKINKGEIEDIQKVNFNFCNGTSPAWNRYKNKKLPRYMTSLETEAFIAQKRGSLSEVEQSEIKAAFAGSVTVSGKKYILINPVFIHVPDWQRNTDMAKVEEIVTNFSEDKFDPIKVYKSNDGLLSVADGAHRNVAFIKREEYKILAEVLGCSEEEATCVFLEQSAGRKPMSVSDTYRAGVKARHEEYMRFKQLFESHNIQIAPELKRLENPIGVVVPSRSLLRMANKEPELLGGIISLIYKLDWCGSTKNNAFTWRNFVVLKRLYATYGKQIEEKLLNKCSGSSFFENKVAPIKSNAEMYDMLVREM